VRKRCVICGRFFIPDPRVKDRQKACGRQRCRKGRKQLAQDRWCKKNPAYFKGRYPYVKEWRQRRAEAGAHGKGIGLFPPGKDPEGPSRRKPVHKLTLLAPEGFRMPSVPPSLVFKRVSRTCFVAVGVRT
jgi:hypothetical protein